MAPSPNTPIGWCEPPRAQCVDVFKQNAGFPVADRHPTAGPVLHELRHPHHHPVATEQRRRAGVQRVRPLLQAARRQPALGDAQGRHTDAQAQAEEARRRRPGRDGVRLPRRSVYTPRTPI